MPGLRRTALRLVPVYALVCGLGVAIGAYLDFAALRAAYLDVVRARFSGLASQLVINAETSLALQTPLAEQDTLLALARREQGLDRLILSIDIVDAKEAVLLSTVPGRIGGKALPSPEAILLREPIRDDIGRTIGQIAIRYDAMRVGSAVEQLWFEMLRIAVPAALAAMLLGSMLAWLLLRQLAARIDVAADPARWRGEAARARDSILQRCLSVAHRLGGAQPEQLAEPAPRARREFWPASLGEQHLRLALAGTVVAILAGALLVVGARMSVTGTLVLVPELERNAESVARSIGATVERAIEYGVPARSIPGLERYFADHLAGNRELGAVRFRMTDGSVVAEAIAPGRPSGGWVAEADSGDATIRQAGAPIGAISVAVAPDVAQARISALWLDQAIIVFVATLIALELLALAVGRRDMRGLADLEARLMRLSRGRLDRSEVPRSSPGIEALARRLDAALESVAAVHRRVEEEARKRGSASASAQLRGLSERHGVGVSLQPPPPDAAEAVRPALFLFMLSEELTRPLLPSHVRSFELLGLGFSAEFAMSLPIVVFMAVMALSQPLLGPLSDRVSSRRLFGTGAVLGAIGHVAAALAPDYWAFVAARCLTALGYALVFVAAQSHMIGSAPPERRANALAVFVRAIMVAALCGPPIGGIIADRIGGGATFACAALIAAASSFVALRLLTDAAPRPSAPASARAAGRLLTSPSLVAVLVGCALPAKIVLAALCFYLVPLHLTQEGYDLATIGRLQMLYPIVMVICVPVFAMFADRWNARAGFVIAGGVVAGLASFYPSAIDAPWAIALVLLQLGVGQALSIAPQSALVADLGQKLTGSATTGVVMGFFRFVERLGNAAGPAIAAVLLASFGFAGTLGAIGGGVIAGALVFLAVLFASRRAAPSLASSKRSTP